ncbi:MAG TPA: hypothetical protein VMP01_18330 [Pirellulaceae bacterium]|nr:hypothetical protein [Pirellulaceae bacterium]
MQTLPHANGRPQPMPRSAETQENPASGPRFTIEPADLAPPNSEADIRDPELAAASPASADTPPADKKPRPKAKKRRRNSMRDRQERVSDMKKLLPRKVPRLRDLQIYESVVFEKMSQHLVAEIFGLSQVRILQIVREVRAWKSTVPYDIPGMTDQQQINLATHETRQWLVRIRDKCFEQADMISSGETKTYIDESQNTTRRTISQRSVTPKPGFMAVALAAVNQAGKLAGAGEQWVRSRAQHDDATVCRKEMTNDQVPMTNDQVPMTNEQPATCDEIPNPELRVPNGATANPQSEICNPQSTGHLLKKKTPEFSPQNGKANGKKSSAFHAQAQVERSRRQKKRQTAYRAAAEREGIKPEARPRFYRLLRDLDLIADRVEERVEAEIKRDRTSRTPEERKLRTQSDRQHFLELFLRVSAGILTPPYDFHWVFDRYSTDTGRFRWAEDAGNGDTG